ncbi:glycosyltransferase family 2 protein, partial [Candidatus Dependentiae bacterium]|nr:glycosyltransferase family 2 protein [Candidatus Dependentiae bacterium]
MNRLLLIRNLAVWLCIAQMQALISGISHCSPHHIPSFVLLVTSYNNERYVERNLQSLMEQRSSRPYKIIYIDDCSTDSTGRLVDQFVTRHSLPSSFIEVVHNIKRKGTALENIYTTVHSSIPDDAVVVSIDGDDMLAHKGVLERLEK